MAFTVEGEEGKAVVKTPSGLEYVVLAEGSGKEMIFRVICEISNASSVVLQIDPTIVIASKTYVDNSMAAHTAAVEPHIRRPALRWFLRNQ